MILQTSPVVSSELSQETLWLKLWCGLSPNNGDDDDNNSDNNNNNLTMQF